MSNEQAPQSLWQRDLPAASDLTFVLATLQRIEKRRLRRGMSLLLITTALATWGGWLFWPSVAPLLDGFVKLLPPAWTPLEWSLLALLAVIVCVELNLHRFWS